jgi:UDP-N-acetylglucosamine 2-epimerase (non-hydrolysing)
MTICAVVGARPNFMKVAPIVGEARRRGLPLVLVHTGQHYDARMSSVFFDELGMPQPDEYLGVGSSSHAEQTAKIMLAFEGVCERRRPRLVLVAGDVNSTLACALVASKLPVPIAHVESGLRSFDRSMPEEINRVLVDHLSDLLFTTEPSGMENLVREGVDPRRIHFVGNTMIDSLCAHLTRAVAKQPWLEYGVSPGEYALVTLHRPSNVDSPDALSRVAAVLQAVSQEMPVLFPVHPRTLAKGGDSIASIAGLRLLEPLGYLEFIGLMAKARVVLTDSGGIQEETTALGVPCVTLRPNTERPITLSQGTNRLVAIDPKAVLSGVHQPLTGPRRTPELWDGKAARRIVDVVSSFLN